jgi:hypothetical protein
VLHDVHADGPHQHKNYAGGRELHRGIHRLPLANQPHAAVGNERDRKIKCRNEPQGQALVERHDPRHSEAEARQDHEPGRETEQTCARKRHSQRHANPE